MDVDGRWVTGDKQAQIVWEDGRVPFGNRSSKTNLRTWEVKRATELLFSETNDRSEWGALYLTGPADVSYESGDAAEVRRRFVRQGSLSNENDRDYRPVSDRQPVFAFAKSFNLSSKTHGSGSVLFTIAHVQDPMAQFASARGLTLMRPLWMSWFPTVKELLAFHYADFASASTLAGNYSQQLAGDAYLSGADDYVDIVTLSARQVMGSTSFSGTPEDPLLFLKEISSDGNTQTIDVIFPAFPFFLYTNPRWLAYMLEPLLEHMLSGQYPNTYAMHDLGTHFPNATGHSDGNDEYMPVEECGNILIVGLAVANSLRYSGDSIASSVWASMGDPPSAARLLSSSSLDDESDDAALFPLGTLQEWGGIDKQDGRWGGGVEGEFLAEKWIERSYQLWTQWTGYLVDFSLEPANQRKSPPHFQMKERFMC